MLFLYNNVIKYIALKHVCHLNYPKSESSPVWKKIPDGQPILKFFWESVNKHGRNIIFI